MVSYLTVIAIGSSLTTFLSLLLVLWGAYASSGVLMVAGLSVMAALALAWCLWVLVLVIAGVRSWLKKPSQQIAEGR